MTRRLFLVDDLIARGWGPLTVTRPAGEILFGALLLRERLEQATGLPAVGYLAAPGLEGFAMEGVPSVVRAGEVPKDQALVLLSSRYAPPLSGDGPTEPIFPAEVPDGGARLVAGGSQVGWLLPPGAALPAEEELTGEGTVSRHGSTIVSDTIGELGDSRVELPGSVLETPWELVRRNADQLSQDLSTLYPEGQGQDAHRLPAMPGVEQFGADPVSAGEDVVVDPGAVLDTTSGPIHLASGVRVRPLTHLQGPAFVGTGSTLLGGLFQGLSCGPMCNLRGEISTSILLGYTNKAHDGYLGHSLVGRWVNLGAMTTNSDLKNNYGSVRVTTADGETDTGLLKLGVFLGDHVKTGIGMTLNAGTTVGVGTNLFGEGLPPKLVPPFHWGTGRELVPYRLDAFLKSAERAMGRRGVRLTSGESALLTRIWHGVHGDEVARGAP